MTKLTRWDVLNACSHTEWRTCTDLIRRMTATGQDRDHIAIAFVFVSIEQLEDEGLVETRENADSKRFEARITQAGIRLRYERSLEADPLPSGLKPA